MSALSEAFELAGYEITRIWTRDDGTDAMMVRPPTPPADLDAVTEIITGSGAVPVSGYPTWMPLRKLALVVTTGA